MHAVVRVCCTSGLNAKHSPAHKDVEYEATPTRFYGVMRRLFPVLLRLAAGSEPVAQQLFRELVLALVHWFTRSARKCVGRTQRRLHTCDTIHRAVVCTPTCAALQLIDA